MNLKIEKIELTNLYNTIKTSSITLLSGNSGVGKTRLAIEVCKRFEDEGYKVWCIKNNGQAIFDDIRFYLSDHQNVLVFIDDANQTSNLEYILNYVTNYSENISIKILMTARDYAKKHVEMAVRKYFSLEEIIIDPFTTDEIKAILKSNLEIENSDFLDRITKIARGNARLAILAGYFSLQKGFTGIKNATDIFKNYYGEVIDSQKLQKTDISVLFAVSLMGTVSIDGSNDFVTKLLEYFDIDALNFLNICHRLNEMELIDLYQDQIAKISDQSFGNYILEYVLLEKKYISVRKLLENGFPKFRNKLIYALNTVRYLFPNDDNVKYIEEQINESWDQADSDVQSAYLQSFHNLNQEKALKIIKSELDRLDAVSKDLMQFDFDAAKKHQNIKNEYIDMLGDFKNSEYLEDVVSLLFTAFLKRPDLVMDFYYVFTEKLSFDLNSHKNDYETEYIVIKSLWELSQKESVDKNFKIFFVHVLKKTLNCSIQKVMPGDNSNAFNFITFSIIDTKGTRLLRDLIWKILSSLYQYDILQAEINTILGEYHGESLGDNQVESIFEFDLTCIKKYFVDNWDNPSFDQFLVMKKIVDIATQLGVKYDKVYLQYEQNLEFMVYNTISKESWGEDWKNTEQENLAKVIDMVKDYTMNEYSLFFELCKKIESKDVAGRKNWIIGRNITHIFNTFKDRQDYMELVQQYLLSEAPYASSVQYSVLNTLVKTLGILQSIQFINKYEFTDKKMWLGNIWEYVEATNIDSEIKEKMLVFFTSQKKDEGLVVPNILTLSHYFTDDLHLVKKIGEWLIFEGKSDSNVIKKFLGSIYDKECVKKILKIFKGNMALLEQLYLLSTSDSNFDYNGTLLETLISSNIEVWNKYTKQISSFSHIEVNKEIFKKIWHFESYTDYVKIAYNNLVANDLGYIRESISGSLIVKDKNLDSVIRERQDTWVKNYIRDNYEDTKSIKRLFEVIQASFSNKIDYYLEFLKCSKDVDRFKLLPLSPLSYTWSGSEVPLIDKRINFVDDLINLIKGIEFIDHILYLKDRKKSLEQFRKKTQIKEYTEEYDRI